MFMPLCCAIMPFPAGKLLYLALKQVARPVSRQLQALSRTNDFMRRRILVPVGQRELLCHCSTVCFVEMAYRLHSYCDSYNPVKSIDNPCSGVAAVGDMGDEVPHTPTLKRSTAY